MTKPPLLDCKAYISAPLKQRDCQRTPPAPLNGGNKSIEAHIDYSTPDVPTGSWPVNHGVIADHRQLGREWRWARGLFGCLALIAFTSTLNGPVPPTAALPANGEYVALRALSPKLAEGTEKWFHEILLTNDGLNVSMEAIPVYFDKGVRFESASDGGFWTYKGKIIKTDSGLSLDLKLTYSAYERITDTAPKWDLTINPDGSLKIDGLIYNGRRRVAESETAFGGVLESPDT